MPRRKRYDEIFSVHLTAIERQSSLLGIALSDAHNVLKPFCPHYDAISDLRRQLAGCINLLHNRPRDWRPGGGFFAPGDIERGREQARQDTIGHDARAKPD